MKPYKVGKSSGIVDNVLCQASNFASSNSNHSTGSVARCRPRALNSQSPHYHASAISVTVGTHPVHRSHLRYWYRTLSLSCREALATIFHTLLYRLSVSALLLIPPSLHSVPPSSVVIMFLTSHYSSFAFSLSLRLPRLTVSLPLRSFSLFARLRFAFV